MTHAPSAPVEIRPAEPADVPALARLAVETFTAAAGDSFEAADLAAHLDAHLSEACIARMIAEDAVLLAETAGRMIGFVQFGAVKMAVDGATDADRELSRLYVLVAYQGLGIGTRLMAAALDHPKLSGAPNVYLDVWEHNHGAQKLYRRFGFTMIGKHRLNLASGADSDVDLIMVRRQRPA